MTRDGQGDLGSGVRFLARATKFIFLAKVRHALGPTQPPVEWAPGVPSPELKRPVRLGDHLIPSSAEFK